MMKKHLSVLLLVTLLLIGVYVVGRPAHTTAPTKPATQSTKPSKPAQSTSPATFNKSQYSIDDPASIWVVVNKHRPLNPKDYAPTDLTSIGNGQRMRAEAASAYTQLVATAKAAGYILVPESGYRSYDTQVSVYGSEVKAYGQAKADNESARPGYSEHQTGWAVDIGQSGCYEDCFGTRPASKWLLANAYRYGFIRRYPSDKATITGYREEPWHFRYIGVGLATEMHTENVETLEEFFGLNAAPDYQ